MRNKKDIELKELVYCLALMRKWLDTIIQCNDKETLISIHDEIKRLIPETDVQRAFQLDLLSFIQYMINLKETKDNDK